MWEGGEKNKKGIFWSPGGGGGGGSKIRAPHFRPEMETKKLSFGRVKGSMAKQQVCSRCWSGSVRGAGGRSTRILSLGESQRRLNDMRKRIRERESCLARRWKLILFGIGRKSWVDTTS